MRERSPPLPTPPDRLPYILVRAGERDWWLRVPSLHQVGTLSKAMKSEHLDSLFKLTYMKEHGWNVISAGNLIRDSGSELLELLAALIGLSWRDPVWSLDTPQPSTWTEEHASAYGAAVFDELYEAGWRFEHVIMLMLALLEQVVAMTSFEEATQERIRFFLAPKATPSVEGSTSSSETSTGGAAEASTN